MTGGQLSIGHMSSLLGEINSMSSKDVLFLVPSNKATLNKIMKQPKLMVPPPHPVLFLGPAIFFSCLSHVHNAFTLSPYYLRPSKVSPNPVLARFTPSSQ